MGIVRQPIKAHHRVKISPKLVDFSRWSRIDEVHEQLDNGASPNSLLQWVLERGYHISLPMLYEYAKLRRQALVHGVTMAHVLGIAGKPLFDSTSPAIQTSRDKLKSEIDALDLLIQRGYETLRQNPGEPIHPVIMMNAIKLKNELTDGQHGFLTNYGMEYLRDIENRKYSMIIDHLISYIPKDKQKEAVDKIQQIEDQYYQTTEYYEEYLRTLGDLSEAEIQRRLNKWKENRETMTLTVM